MYAALRSVLFGLIAYGISIKENLDATFLLFISSLESQKIGIFRSLRVAGLHLNFINRKKYPYQTRSYLTFHFWFIILTTFE